MFKMEWLPPGRGLWMMGTQFAYERGSMALYNCSAIDTANDLVLSAEWAMDCLMNGVGVGFSTYWRGNAIKPDKKDFENIKLTPTTLVVNHRGEIVNTIIGILNFTKIHDAIDKLLQDSKVLP